MSSGGFAAASGERRKRRPGPRSRSARADARSDVRRRAHAPSRTEATRECAPHGFPVPAGCDWAVTDPVRPLRHVAPGMDRHHSQERIELTGGTRSKTHAPRRENLNALRAENPASRTERHTNRPAEKLFHVQLGSESPVGYRYEAFQRFDSLVATDRLSTAGAQFDVAPEDREVSRAFEASRLLRRHAHAVAALRGGANRAAILHWNETHAASPSTASLGARSGVVRKVSNLSLVRCFGFSELAGCGKPAQVEGGGEKRRCHARDAEREDDCERSSHPHHCPRKGDHA